MVRMLFSLCVVLCVTVYTDAVTVNTKYGDVQGQTHEVHAAGSATKSVNSFLAIPFAKAPTGQLRFAVRI